LINTTNTTSPRLVYPSNVYCYITCNRKYFVTSQSTVDFI